LTDLDKPSLKYADDLIRDMSEMSKREQHLQDELREAKNQLQQQKIMKEDNNVYLLDELL